MKSVLQVGNGIAFVSMVFVNYLSNTGLMNNTTIGDISDDYRSLFTPAGYTFAIWGLIYLLLFGFVVYQGRSLWLKTVKQDHFVIQTGWWFIISCVFNIAWIFAWIYEQTGASCILILLLLFSILKIVFNNRMSFGYIALSKRVFLWWPFVVYSGWVTVASIVNMSTYLIKIGWDAFGIPQHIWAIILITIATIINVLVVFKRHMRAFALVGAWALVGIGNANLSSTDIVAYTAFGAAVGLVMVAIIHLFVNKSTSLLAKT